jgi:streptogramin lyase
MSSKQYTDQNGKSPWVTFVLSFVFILIFCTGCSVFSVFSTQVHASSYLETEIAVLSGTNPAGTAFDASGNIWIAVPGCNPFNTCSSAPPGKLEEYNPNTNTWTILTLPAGFAQPLYVAFDASRNIWFPMSQGNTIGEYNPHSHTCQQWSVPTSNSGPWDITIDHNGYIWFTEKFVNKIARFDPVNHTFMEVATPAKNSNPYGITVDSSNNIWFTENNGSVALIGEYTSSGQLKEYKIRNTLPGTNLTPHLIAVDPNGNIWWTEGLVGEIGELNVSQAQAGTNQGVTEYRYPRSCVPCGVHTSGISIDRNGLVWFDDSYQGILGSFPDTGTGSFNMYNAPTLNTYVSDGVQVDSQNRVWYGESNINKIVELTQEAAVPTQTTTSVLAQDSFQRPNQTHWGTASDGNTWGDDANDSDDASFSIKGNTAQVTNGNGIIEGTLGPSVSDSQVFFTGSTSSFTNTDFGAVLRFTDSNNWYKAYLDGTNLIIRRNQNGNNVVIATTAFTAKANASYSLRFQAVGTQLSAKAWVAGSSEPANWMLSINDNALTSGNAGLQVSEQGSSTVTYTSFIAYMITPVTPTPTPTQVSYGLDKGWAPE